MVEFGLCWYNLVCCVLVLFGVVEIGLVWLNSVWCGLFGLVL